MRKDLGFEYCRSESDRNPFVAGPLKRIDCSLVSEGAAALVISQSRETFGTALPPNAVKAVLQFTAIPLANDAP